MLIWRKVNVISSCSLVLYFPLPGLICYILQIDMTYHVSYSSYLIWIRFTLLMFVHVFYCLRRPQDRIVNHVGYNLIFPCVHGPNRYRFLLRGVFPYVFIVVLDPHYKSCVLSFCLLVLICVYLLAHAALPVVVCLWWIFTCASTCAHLKSFKWCSDYWSESSSSPTQSCSPCMLSR